MNQEPQLQAVGPNNVLLTRAVPRAFDSKIWGQKMAKALNITISSAFFKHAFAPCVYTPWDPRPLKT